MIRLCTVLFALLLPHLALADVLRVAVTTSFENSGLADILTPKIEADLNLDLQLLVVGTGQAIRLGEAGDVDAILVHSRSAEDAFVASGNGTHRREIMYNDFVIIGPKDDPANLTDAPDVSTAMQRLRDAPFVSRGDDSGTHKAELALWQDAGIDANALPPTYREVGAGMGTALNIAAGMNAYILADRASWLNFQNKSDLALLFQGDAALFNQYAYLPVNPDRHASVRHDLALKLEEWLVSPKAKGAINGYTIAGQPLFVFNATD